MKYLILFLFTFLTGCSTFCGNYCQTQFTKKCQEEFQYNIGIYIKNVDCPIVSKPTYIQLKDEHLGSKDNVAIITENVTNMQSYILNLESYNDCFRKSLEEKVNEIK